MTPGPVEPASASVPAPLTASPESGSEASAHELLPPPPRRGPGAVGLWVRVGLAVALLAASALGRAWQARRVDEMLRDGRVSPFPLADIPHTLGTWTGHDEALDTIIARATGSTDRMNRVYQDTVTGQKVSVIVLFGPSTEMFVHAPEVCYPASGYDCVSGPIHRNLVVGDGQWPFRELVYHKGEGGSADQQDVYYCWRYGGRWTPNITTMKGFERLPGMFKVQVARPAKDQELDLLSIGNPCELFLTLLMPEIEQRIAHATKAPAAR